MLLYIIRKQIDLRISSTINNYRIYQNTRKGKNVLINSDDLIDHRDVTSRISAVCVRSTRCIKFSKGGGRTDPKLAWYVYPGMANVPCKFRLRGVCRSLIRDVTRDIS